jgi:hypothetical protein
MPMGTNEMDPATRIAAALAHHAQSKQEASRVTGSDEVSV